MLGSTSTRARTRRRAAIAAGVVLTTATAVAAGVAAASAPPTAFTSPADASETAVGVLPAILEGSIGRPVIDPACSHPPTGAAGEQFVCYATKDGPAFVQVRVTIGDGRQLSIEIEVNQPSPGEFDETPTEPTG